MQSTSFVNSRMVGLILVVTCILFSSCMDRSSNKIEIKDKKSLLANFALIYGVKTHENATIESSIDKASGIEKIGYYCNDKPCGLAMLFSKDGNVIAVKEYVSSEFDGEPVINRVVFFDNARIQYSKSDFIYCAYSQIENKMTFYYSLILRDSNNVEIILSNNSSYKTNLTSSSGLMTVQLNEILSCPANPMLASKLNEFRKREDDMMDTRKIIFDCDCVQ